MISTSSMKLTTVAATLLALEAEGHATLAGCDTRPGGLCFDVGEKQFLILIKNT